MAEDKLGRLGSLAEDVRPHARSDSEVERFTSAIRTSGQPNICRTPTIARQGGNRKAIRGRALREKPSLFPFGAHAPFDGLLENDVA
jgi:hypothetical protein